MCTGLRHRVFIVESLDADSESRRLSPMALWSGGYLNLVNGAMDHGWCLERTCLRRLMTLYSIISTGRAYNLVLTSTPPTSTRFMSLHASQNESTRISMFYSTPQRLDVYRNGIYIAPTSYGLSKLPADTSSLIPSLGAIGGSNFHDRDNQYVHFIVRGNEPVTVIIAQVIAVGLKLGTSIDKFYDTAVSFPCFIIFPKQISRKPNRILTPFFSWSFTNAPQENFIKNLATILRIDVSKIRLVKVVNEKSKTRRDDASDEVSIKLEIGDPPLDSLSTSNSTQSAGLRRRDSGPTSFDALTGLADSLMSHIQVSGSIGDFGVTAVDIVLPPVPPVSPAEIPPPTTTNTSTTTPSVPDDSATDSDSVPETPEIVEPEFSPLPSPSPQPQLQILGGLSLVENSLLGSSVVLTINQAVEGSLKYEVKDTSGGVMTRFGRDGTDVWTGRIVANYTEGAVYPNGATLRRRDGQVIYTALTAPGKFSLQILPLFMAFSIPQD
jgi:hypothetical protein